MSQHFLNTTTHSVAWIVKRLQDGELQLKAPFQRNPVWTVKQKSYLIDTILRGYPIPELYMQEFTDAQGNDLYIVVDGQQRIRACYEFVVDEFKMDAEDSPDWGDMSFSELSEENRKQVYNYKFVVRILPDMPEEQLRSMFQRLNRNVVALNQQELRHATYWGRFINCMETLANDERWSGFEVFTPNDVRRMLDTEFISELATGYLHGLQNKKQSLDKWYEAYEETFEAESELTAIFNNVLGELRACVPELSSTRWRKKSDFYTLFLVFAELNAKLPLAREARAEVRSKLVEFGVHVDQFLRDSVEFAAVTDAVKRYANAVERAASDLANRRGRRAEVFDLISDNF